jgi:hypothetical protein
VALIFGDAVLAWRKSKNQRNWGGDDKERTSRKIAGTTKGNNRVRIDSTKARKTIN